MRAVWVSSLELGAEQDLCVGCWRQGVLRRAPCWEQPVLEGDVSAHRGVTAW